MNLFTLLSQTATRLGEDAAVFHGRRQVHTWAQLADRALRLAASLGRQTADGARIAVVSENRPELVELLFGVWAGERVCVPINFKLHPREMAQIIDDCGAERVFASPKIATRLSPLTTTPIEVLGTPEYHQWYDAEPSPPPHTDPQTLAWLFYTSGTTGRPKGAMLTHRSLMLMTVAYLADYEAPDRSCSLLHAAPMSHGSGMYIPAYVARGARQVIPESGGFDPAEMLDLCGHHPGASVFLAPTMVRRLVDTAGAAPQSLRTVIYGGGPMYVEDLRRAMAVFGPVFEQVYGQGEAPMTITGLRRADHLENDPALLGSVGYARSGVEIAVLSSAGQRAAVGQVGEIVCRGDVVMSGYWNNPDATAATLRNGWLYTGDMGSVDARGYLTLRDRSKDVVISGGTNIYPREVEEALLTHPQVIEAAVVGMPDPEWGENVVAFVVGAASPASLDQHLLDRIARFKRPKRYEFVDELPKNSYGKVLKRELRARLAPAPH